MARIERETDKVESSILQLQKLEVLSSIIFGFELCSAQHNPTSLDGVLFKLRARVERTHGYCT